VEKSKLISQNPNFLVVRPSLNPLGNLGPLVHKEILYVWHEVAALNSLLVACDRGGLLYYITSVKGI
jgi:hypothetical protein